MPAAAGRLNKTFKQAKASAAWMSMRRGAGRAGIITRHCRCWQCSFSNRNACEWEKNLQTTVPEVRAVLMYLLDVWSWDEREIIAWSRWRQHRNRIAKESHCRRRERLRRKRVLEKAL